MDDPSMTITSANNNRLHRQLNQRLVERAPTSGSVFSARANDSSELQKSYTLQLFRSSHISITHCGRFGLKRRHMPLKLIVVATRRNSVVAAADQALGPALAWGQSKRSCCTIRCNQRSLERARTEGAAGEMTHEQILQRTKGGHHRPRPTRTLVVLATMLLVIFGGTKAMALEVTLVMNTPERDEVKGTLKEVKEDGTITLIGTYGVQTFRRDQYLSAVCPEPPEQALANQSYLKGEYAKALALYEEVYTKYRALGWGALSLEGMGNCHRQMAHADAAIEAYSKLIEEYPTYAGGRRVKLSLGQTTEAKGNLARAVELYEEISLEGDDELSAISLRNIARILYAREKYHDALLHYLRVAILYQNLPNAPVAECTFMAGDCFEKLAKDQSPEVAARLRERAKKYYLDVITRFPQSDFAKQAQVRYQQLTAGAATSGTDAEEKPSAEITI